MISPSFTEQDHKTWQTLYRNQTPLRSQQMVSVFSQGLTKLGITDERIPQLSEVNSKLKPLTGWQGVFVKGFEEPRSFFKMLSEKKFPIGSFIRSPEDLSYTPEPDIFHDLYGHMPFFIDSQYGDFCQEFGNRALKYVGNEQIVKEFQRLFWFMIEFGLLETVDGNRIFGAGIASSHSECAYALSNKPQVKMFNIEDIRRQDFRIDMIQNILFKIKSTQDLYSCLEEFEKPYRK